MALVMSPNQIRENTLEDADGDTKVEVEASSDEDKIRFHTANTQRMIVDETGKVGIGSADPISELDVAGKIAITAEVATPTAPVDGKGWLYTKNDGKLYWQSFDVNETDLTSGGGGGISSVVGTSDEVEAVTDGSTVTVGLPDDVIISGTLAAGFYKTNGTSIIESYGAATDVLKVRGYKTERHIRITTTASGWQTIISFRPKVTGTGADPAASSFYGATGGTIEIGLHANGVGNGYRRMEFVVFYNGSSASSADGFNNDTSGTVVDFRINRSGWDSALQIQRSGSIVGLNGWATVNLNFGKGAGSNGDNIYWEVADGVF